MPDLRQKPRRPRSLPSIARAAAVLLAAAGALLLASACGGGSESPAGASPSGAPAQDETVRALAELARQYYGALAARDFQTAYSLYSGRCHAGFTPEDLKAGFPSGVPFPDLPQEGVNIEVGQVIVDTAGPQQARLQVGIVAVADSRREVLSTSTDPPVRVVQESAGWRFDELPGKC